MGGGAPTGTVPDLLGERAAEDPDGVALVVHGVGTLTYGGWDDRSDAIGRGLAGRGVQRGDRVGLLFDNARWLDYAASYLGVLKAGAVAVPLGPRFSVPELARLLDHCGAGAVVGPVDLAPALPVPGWRASPSEVEAPGASEPFLVPVGAGDLAEIIYTSGTTGTPKGVACSHGNLGFHELPPDQAGPSGGPGGGPVGGPVGGPARICFLHSFPVGTNAGQEVLRMPLRRSGRTAVVLPEFDPDRLGRAVAEHGVTRLQLVPAMARMLLDAGVQHRHDLSGVDRVILSSAPVPSALLPRLAKAFPGAVLLNAYALTESGTARTLLSHAEDRPGSVGRPVGDSEVRVVDEADRPLAAGRVGEVWLRRPGAPRREYYRDPEATRAAFAGDWLRTGDLGYLDDGGYLYIVDRKKDVIIRGGVNVASLEVENVLSEHPAVVEAAVFAVPHEVLGQDVAAAVVASSATTQRELQDFVRGRLAEHQTPHRILMLDHLPRNPSGKVLKRELAAAMAGTTMPVLNVPGGDSAPLTPTERAVVAVWEEVLGRRGIALSDDFFELGGHSLAAAQVAARLEDALGARLPLTAVFDSPTVAELAAAVDDLRRTGGDGREDR